MRDLLFSSVSLTVFKYLALKFVDPRSSLDQRWCIWPLECTYIPFVLLRSNLVIRCFFLVLASSNITDVIVFMFLCITSNFFLPKNCFVLSKWWSVFRSPNAFYIQLLNRRYYRI